MKIYVASSWRNALHAGIVHALRRCGHEVYDAHPIAKSGYEHDIGALRWCEAVVYVMPCGRSASWEFGYAMGQGKPGYVVMFGDDEPDLMFSEATLITTMDELFDAFGEPVENAAS